MNLTSIIKNMSNEFNLNQKDVLKVAYNTIERAIESFKEEVRIAKNVETLEFLRRTVWDQLFSINGCYYDLCKRSPMLKILRLNADIRYCQVLKRLVLVEEQEISYRIVQSDVQTRSRVLKRREQEQVRVCVQIGEEVDGELVEETY